MVIKILTYYISVMVNIDLFCQIFFLVKNFGCKSHLGVNSKVGDCSFRLRYIWKRLVFDLKNATIHLYDKN